MFQSVPLAGRVSETVRPRRRRRCPRDLPNIAQQALLHHVHRAEEQVVHAALPRAHDERLVVVFLAGVADQLVLFERQRQRLLAEDVLAGLQGLDGDFDVPVVGASRCSPRRCPCVRAPCDSRCRRRPCPCRCSVVFGLFGMARIDVAHGHDVAEAACSRASPVPIPPRPMQPIFGRSLAAALANAFWLQLTYGIALPAAARVIDFFRKSQREACLRVMETPMQKY